MPLLKRLTRFGAVGILATAIHALVLLLLVQLALVPTGLANLVAFVVAFIFSAAAQQAITFKDRLAGQTLKKRSLAILFLTNCAVAYGLGSQVHGPYVVALALVPSLVNFTLLHFFSGHPDFKR
ncbi:MAG: GtrA-like protein [Cyanobacteriota bacterium]|jgi:putative flippase GtrA